MPTSIFIPDAAACAAASRNERECEAPACTVIAALVVVAFLMLGGYAVAGLAGAGLVVSMLGLLVIADWFSDAVDEATESKAVRR